MRDPKRSGRRSWRLVTLLLVFVVAFAAPGIVEACNYWSFVKQANNAARNGNLAGYCRALRRARAKHPDQFGGIAGNVGSGFNGPSVDECNMMFPPPPPGQPGGGLNEFGDARLFASGGSAEVGTTKAFPVTLASGGGGITWDIFIDEDPTNPDDGMGTEFFMVDQSGPAGTPTAFTTVGPLAVADCVTIGVNIIVDPSTPIGSVGNFTARAINTDNNMPVENLNATFSVTAVGPLGVNIQSLVLTPTSPMVKGPGAATLTLSATVDNTSAAPVAAEVQACPLTDPPFPMEFCDGSFFDVFDRRRDEFRIGGEIQANYTTQFTFPVGQTVIELDIRGELFCSNLMVGCCKFRLNEIAPISSVIAPIDTTQYALNTDPTLAGPGTPRNGCPVLFAGTATADGIISYDVAGFFGGTVPVTANVTTGQDVVDQISRQHYQQLQIAEANPSSFADAPLTNGIPYWDGTDSAMIEFSAIDRAQIAIQASFDAPQTNGLQYVKGGNFDDVRLVDVDVQEQNGFFDAFVTIDFVVGAEQPPDGVQVLLTDTTVREHRIIDTSQLPFNIPSVVSGGTANCPAVPGFTVREENGLCIYTSTIVFPALGIVPGTMITVQIDPFDIINIENPAGGQQLSADVLAGVVAAVGGGGGGFCGAGSPLAVVVILILRNFWLARRRKD